MMKFPRLNGGSERKKINGLGEERTTQTASRCGCCGNLPEAEGRNQTRNRPRRRIQDQKSDTPRGFKAGIVQSRKHRNALLTVHWSDRPGYQSGQVDRGLSGKGPDRPHRRSHLHTRLRPPRLFKPARQPTSSPCDVDGGNEALSGFRAPGLQPQRSHHPLEFPVLSPCTGQRRGLRSLSSRRRSTDSAIAMATLGPAIQAALT